MKAREGPYAAEPEEATEGGEMHDSKLPNPEKKCPVAEEFNAGDEVELLAWLIFGSRGYITSTHSSPFRHPFHVRTDLGYIVGVFPHEIRHPVAGAPMAGEEQSGRLPGKNPHGKRRHG